MDREQALAWAEAARSARAALRDGLSSQRIDLAEVLQQARVDGLVGVVTLRFALESLPDARKIDTRRRVAAMGVDDSVPLASLDDEVVTRILDAFGADVASR